MNHGGKGKYLLRAHINQPAQRIDRVVLFWFFASLPLFVIAGRSYNNRSKLSTKHLQININYDIFLNNNILKCSIRLDHTWSMKLYFINAINIARFIYAFA